MKSMEQAATSLLRNNGWDLLTSKCVVCTYVHALYEVEWNVDWLIAVYFNFLGVLSAYAYIGKGFQDHLFKSCFRTLSV